MAFALVTSTVHTRMSVARVSIWLLLCTLTACGGAAPPPPSASQSTHARAPETIATEPSSKVPVATTPSREPSGQAAVGEARPATQPPSRPSVSLQEANRLYASYFQIGDYDAAQEYALKALHLSERQLGSDHPTTAGLMANVGSVYQRLGRMAEAEALLKHALVGLATHFGDEHAATLNAKNSLAAVLIEQRKLDAAERLLSGVLAVGGKLRNQDVGIVAAALNNLAAVEKGRGNEAAALRLYRQALPLAEAVYGPRHKVSDELRQRIQLSEQREAHRPPREEPKSVAVAATVTKASAVVERQAAPATEHRAESGSGVQAEPSTTPVSQRSQSETADRGESNVPKVASLETAATNATVEPSMTSHAVLSDEVSTRTTSLPGVEPVIEPPAAASGGEQTIARVNAPPISRMQQAVEAYHERRYEDALAIWHDLAAEGSRRAKRHLGGMYLDGTGVVQSDVDAYFWLTLSSRAGDSIARDLLADLTLRMTGLQIEVAEDMIARSR